MSERMANELHSSLMGDIECDDFNPSFNPIGFESGNQSALRTDLYKSLGSSHGSIENPFSNIDIGSSCSSVEILNLNASSGSTKNELGIESFVSPRKNVLPDKNSGDQLPSVIPLNVGGHHFITRKSTLCKYPNSMLAAMFSGRHKVDTDRDGNYFVDADGSNFKHILEFLRRDVLPPNEVASEVYKEACYYNIEALIDQLKYKAPVCKMLVNDVHRMQFPNYAEFKKKVVHHAMVNGKSCKEGTVTIHPFQKLFKVTAASFNARHDCAADGADIIIGPWEGAADTETLIHTLEQDLIVDGFQIKPHEQRKRCKYYNGQGCTKVVYKIQFLF